jgi:signal transduction histidine kinase
MIMCGGFMLKKLEGSFIVKNDKNIILFTFILIFSIFLVSFIKELNFRKEILKNHIMQKQEVIDSIYASKINFLRNSYSRRLSNLIENEEFKKSVESNDVENVKKILADRFYFFTKENRFVKTLFFVDSNNICLYRAHDPLNNGDDISCNMPIIEEANDTKNSVSMFDAGKYGIFYRVTIPIVYDSGHYGALELGIDFRLFLDKFQDIVDDVYSMLLIDSNYMRDPHMQEWGGYKLLQKDIDIDITKISQNSNEITFEDKTYFIDRNFDIRGKGQKKVAKILFFIDITKQKKDYESAIYTQTISFIISSIMILTIFFFSFKLYKKELEKKSNEIRKKEQYIKEQLENEVQKQINEVQKQERVILEQSKLAIMGEMISMIAHQWRQPLSHISLQLEGLRTEYEFNDKEIDEETFDKYTEKIIERVLYMSNTIDGFRNFFKPDEAKKVVVAKDLVKESVGFMDFSLKNANIKMSLECTCNRYVEIYVGKFMQVVMNIIKNSEDILKEKDENREIVIRGYEADNRVNIEFRDNGGGISSEYIDKIFEPYFSTKSKNATGVGLYMSKMIVDKHLGGLLTAYNDGDWAVFKIQLPIYK